jgi:hypothetical protein
MRILDRVGRLAGFIVLSSSLLFAPAAEAQIGLVTALAKLFAAIAESANRAPPKVPPLTDEELSRGIPEESSFAKMSPPYGRQVSMNRKRLMLAPGAKIVDTHRRIVLPSRVQNPTEVRYVLDGRGDVQTVWLLSELEYDIVAGSSTVPSAGVVASTAGEVRAEPVK